MIVITHDQPGWLQLVDITLIDTREGWLYLARVLDVFSRKIVGWAMDSYMETSLVQRHLLSEELLHHSDRGGQYASHLYQ